MKSRTVTSQLDPVFAVERMVKWNQTAECQVCRQKAAPINESTAIKTRMIPTKDDIPSQNCKSLTKVYYYNNSGETCPSDGFLQQKKHNTSSSKPQNNLAKKKHTTGSLAPTILGTMGTKNEKRCEQE